MKRSVQIMCGAATVILLCTSMLCVYPGPFDGKNFKGRIAFSSDGNYNDEDDWGAFPVAAAMLDACGVTDKLVHVDYCNILLGNDPRFGKEMAESVLGSAKRYNIPSSILFDCQKDLDGAVESIKNAINASSADNPLYYVLAGPMEVPYLGIMKSKAAKRKYVYCISHNSWNDGYTRNDQNLHNHNKRDVIPSGINWIQVKDGNRNLAHPGGVGKKSTPEQWRLYHWMRDSNDSRLGWIFTRLEAELRADISDSTITYFLLTGDEDANLTKLKSLLDDKNIPTPMDPRDYVRFEAENFLALDNFKVEHRNDRRASQRLSVRLASNGRGRIRTPFNQPYTPGSGRYDVEVRYFDAKEGRCRLWLLVNGSRQGDPWSASENSDEWTTHTIPDVSVKTGDRVAVAARSRDGGYTKLDYVQFNRLEFYNDATDVEMMGRKLDSEGNLPTDERRWIEGIVKRFKHHKNIMWGIEESCNKLPAARTPHFKKIGELIAKTDNHNHPIVQSFVVTNDPEGDFPQGGVTSDAYVGDPHIRVVTWLHVVPHKDDFEGQHQEYLSYYKRDADRFVVMKNETYHHPRRGRSSRVYMWSCAMTGMHCLEAYHHADRASDEKTLRDNGRINAFLEQTDFHKMKPRDDLAAGSTKWVLANPPDSYIAYTYDYSGSMGLRGATGGKYDLMWFDPVDGDKVAQTGVSVSSGNVTWAKPDSIGNEVALYMKRR